MEIRIYDNSLNFQGVIENHTSLVWTRRYNDTGDFILTAPVTDRNIKLLQMDRLVYIRGKDEAGVIESRQLTQSENNHTIQVGGRFLDVYMDRRLLTGTTNFTGTVEDGMRSLYNSVDPIPFVELEPRHGYEDTITFQATYKNLLDYEKKLAKSAAYGFRFRPDFTQKKIVFEIYKGLDHSVGQNERNRVEFSENFLNLATSDYTENNQLYKNVCVVGGEGEGSTKIIVTVGDTESTGLSRREIYIEATDVHSNGLTIAQYKEALKQYGRNYLENNTKDARAFVATTNPNGNFIYGRHYDLGDIVTIKRDEWNISDDQRLTEVSEVYEHGEATIRPVFGTPLPEKINWEDIR